MTFATKLKDIGQVLLPLLIITMNISCRASTPQLRPSSIETSPTSAQTATVSNQSASPTSPRPTTTPNTSISTPTIIPEAEQPDSPEETANSFMRNKIGPDYFDTHFTLEQASLSDDLLKATYTYNYSPIVDDSSMTLFLNPTTSTIAEDEISTILLTPQNFKLDKEQAISKASEQGLNATGPFQTELRIGPETDNRFAWWITGPVDSSIEAPPGSLMRVVLDAETGQVYLQDLVGVDTGH